MFSLIITSYNEIENTKNLIQNILSSFNKNDELILVSPNVELKEFLDKQRKEFNKVFIKDSKKGKPAALNLALEKAQGKFIICTDGDVILRENAIPEILKPFQEREVGLASGQPISKDDRNSLFGYWSHFLVNAAHITRQKREDKNQFFVASGYLLAFRNSLIDLIPENTLVDDAWISHNISNQGHKIAYAPLARVEVHFPKNFKDWIKQKLRSVGGYQEKYIKESQQNMRSIKSEAFLGLKLILTFPQSIKEYFYTFLLVIARIYLWLKIIWVFKIQKNKTENLWKRIDSSKY
ncbi:hypothetical protein CL656_06560 [bacterium]|nr:hypothetical protein [bacterium]|tara:strand:+ start:7582 stop:8463 length:882 start_codon:yes stop_codon:yes gene_type:complete